MSHIVGSLEWNEAVLVQSRVEGNRLVLLTSQFLTFMCLVVPSANSKPTIWQRGNK